MTGGRTRLTSALIGVVTLAGVTSCSGETLATEDCAQELRFGGAVYTGYHATGARAAEKEGSAERSECDDHGRTAEGSSFSGSPQRVRVWSFAGHARHDVLGVRLRDGSFVAFLARGLTDAQRDHILRDLGKARPGR